MMMRSSLVVLTCLAVLGCSAGQLDERVSNTGYTGTWQRGGESTKVRMSIVERNGEFRVRKSVISPDGSLILKCDWDGNCEEFIDGEKTSVYTFRYWVDPETEFLRAECHATITSSTPLELHYIDEMLIKDDGLRIRARTLEQQGELFPKKRKPRRDFHKISDFVLDPPEGWSAGNG